MTGSSTAGVSETRGRKVIAVSACLLGEAVRYDGGDRRSAPVVELASEFRIVALCPEVELGMGVPRETIELTETGEGIRLLGSRSGRDWTAPMRRYARARIGALLAEGVAGFVLKSRSPSCGLRGVRVVELDGSMAARGRGLFAEELQRGWPEVPVEDEEGIADSTRRREFVERVRAVVLDTGKGHC